MPYSTYELSRYARKGRSVAVSLRAAMMAASSPLLLDGRPGTAYDVRHPGYHATPAPVRPCITDPSVAHTTGPKGSGGGVVYRSSIGCMSPGGSGCWGKRGGGSCECVVFGFVSLRVRHRIVSGQVSLSWATAWNRGLMRCVVWSRGNKYISRPLVLLRMSLLEVRSGRVLSGLGMVSHDGVLKASCPGVMYPSFMACVRRCLLVKGLFRWGMISTVWVGFVVFCCARVACKIDLEMCFVVGGGIAKPGESQGM